MAATDIDIELHLLIDAIYLKYHYDFRRYAAASLKRRLTEALNERLRPIRVRRSELLDDPGYLSGLLARGDERARAVATQTLTDVRRLMHMDY